MYIPTTINIQIRHRYFIQFKLRLCEIKLPAQAHQAEMLTENSPEIKYSYATSSTHFNRTLVRQTVEIIQSLNPGNKKWQRYPNVSIKLRNSTESYAGSVSKVGE